MKKLIGGTLTLLTVPLLVQSATIPCSQKEYQTFPVVVGCVGADDTAIAVFPAMKQSTAALFPIGLDGMYIALMSSADDRPMGMYDDSTEDCIVGPGAACTFSTSCTAESDYCHTWNGMSISYYSTIRKQAIAVQGILNSKFRVDVFNSGPAATDSVIYKYGNAARCVYPRPGCTVCKNWDSCPEELEPRCDGTANVICTDRPPLAADQNWIEFTFGGSDLPTSGCACCDKPVDPTPVQFAMALALSGPTLPAKSPKGSPVLAAMKLFFSWLNQEHGGICFNTSRRPAELIVLDTQSDISLVEAALFHFAHTQDIYLLFGPTGQDGYSSMYGAMKQASRESALLMSPRSFPPAYSRDFDCDTCFSLMPPRERFFEPAMESLLTAWNAAADSEQAPNRKLRVAYVRSNLSVLESTSTATCDALSALSSTKDFELVGFATYNDTYTLPEAGMGVFTYEPDVVVFCVDTFLDCLDLGEIFSRKTFNAWILEGAGLEDSGLTFEDITAPASFVVSGPCFEDTTLLELMIPGSFVLGVSPYNWWTNMTQSDSTIMPDSPSWNIPAFMALLRKVMGIRNSPQSDEMTGPLPDLEALVDAAIAQSSLNRAEEKILTGGYHTDAILSWSAAEVLLAAIESTDSINPETLAAYLKNKTVNTLLGSVAFDDNGESRTSTTAYQQIPNSSKANVVMEPLIVGGDWGLAPPDPSRSYEQLRTPLPPFGNDRWCYLDIAGASIRAWGLYQTEPDLPKICGLCPENSLSYYIDEKRSRHCNSCPVNEYVNINDDGSRECLPLCAGLLCDAGLYGYRCDCRNCEPGTFNPVAGGSCQNCAPGRFASEASATECELCPEGQTSPDGAVKCMNCSRGTFNPTAGLPQCLPCPHGSQAPDAGMTSCIMCQPGRKSSWDASNCELCPSGKYQNLPNSSVCLDAVEGATFDDTGLTSGVNLDGYWTREMRESLQWELCYSPLACKTNEECSEGAIGVQCGSCVPGYAPAAFGGTACFKCPHIVQNIVLLTAVLIFTISLVVWISYLSLERKRRPRDLRISYMKMIVMYCIIADVLSSTMQDILLGWSSKSLGWSFAFALTRPISIFNLAPGFCFPPETPIFVSIHCFMDQIATLFGLRHLLETTLSSHLASVSSFVIDLKEFSNVGLDDSWSSSELVSTLLWKHSQWFDEASRAGREAIKDYQHYIEFISIFFWLNAPLLVFGLIYIFGYCYVRYHYQRKKDLLEAGSEFYASLVISGTREAVKMYDADEWLYFVQEYNCRWLVWAPFSFLQAEQEEKGRFVFLKTFTKQTTTIFITVLFLSYGSVLHGLLRITKCVEFADEKGYLRSLFANELQCMNFDDPLTLVTFTLAMLWLFGVPLSLSRMLHKQRSNLDQDLEFPPEYTLICFGYRLGCWNWELYSFFLKAVVIALHFLVLDSFLRSSLLVAFSIMHGFIVMYAEPFTSRSDRALVKADGRLGLYFAGNSVLNMFLVLSSGVGSVWIQQVQAAVIVLSSFLLNLWLALYLLHKFYEGCRDSIVEQYSEHSWVLWEDQRRALFEKSFVGLFFTALLRPRTFLTWALKQNYVRSRQAQPYISFDPQLGWVTVCGDRGDKAKITDNDWGPPGTGENISDLSQAPPVPKSVEWEVQESTLAQRRAVQLYLQQAVQRLALIRGKTAFSVLQLEFVIRAAFVLARRIELQSNSVSRDASFVSAAEDYLGMDALQLLMDSYDPDEEHEHGHGHGHGDEHEEEEEAGNKKRGTAMSLVSRMSGQSGLPKARTGSVASKKSEGRGTQTDGEPRRGAGSTFMASGRQSSTGERTKFLSEKTKASLNTKEVCEAFFHDPENVLFFYSQADFVRAAEENKHGIRQDQAEIEAANEELDEVQRQNFIRFAFALFCETSREILVFLWRVYRNTEMKEDREESARTVVTNRLKSAMQRVNDELVQRVDYEWCHGLLERMFDPDTFNRGMELQVFQLGLIAIEHTRDDNLTFLQDVFHEHWYAHRWVTEHRIRMHKGLVQEQWVQTDDSMATERMPKENSEDEAFLQRSREQERENLTMQDFRWMRIVLNVQMYLLDSKTLPSMSDLGQVLKKRRGKLE